MIVTNETYFSPEADKSFLSVSQFNHLVGTPFKRGCEAATMAALRGEWKVKPSTAMLIGSFVDAYFEGTMADFKTANPEIFTLKGELKADFKKAEEIIKVAESDPFFLKYVVGEGLPQVIVTGEIGGYPWKGKIDRLHKGLAVVDLKVVASIKDKVWDDNTKTKVNFIEAYGYINQGAVYQELWYQMSGERLPFFIAAITKEGFPDKEVIHIPDSTLRNALDQIIEMVPYVVSIKTGAMPAIKCGECDYCRSVKKLSETISIYDL